MNVEVIKNKDGAVFVAWELLQGDRVGFGVRLGFALCSPADFPGRMLERPTPLSPGRSLSRKDWFQRGSRKAGRRMQRSFDRVLLRQPVAPTRGDVIRLVKSHLYSVLHGAFPFSMKMLFFGARRYRGAPSLSSLREWMGQFLFRLFEVALPVETLGEPTDDLKFWAERAGSRAVKVIPIAMPSAPVEE